MHLFKTLFSPLVIATAADAFTFKMINKTGKDVWAYCGDHTGGSSVEVMVCNGGTYVCPNPLLEGLGIAIKVAFGPHKEPYKPNYQIEASQRDGVLRYNFSHEEGGVMNDYARTLGGDGCEVKHCDAGSTSCDWDRCPDGVGDCNIAACRPVPGELVATLGQ